jgi:hypothetical protein
MTKTHTRVEAPAAGDTGDVPHDDAETYQQLLDDMLEQTFPASDPISPCIGRRLGEKIQTEKDEVDWALKPSST